MKKKIVLLGDSIRKVGYGPSVQKALEPDFEVWQPEENGRFAQHTLRMLRDYRFDLAGSDLIHFNNGLWDMVDVFDDGPFTPLDQYVETMLRLVRIMKGFAPKLIFATTAPVHPDFPHHSNERIKLFNDTLVPELQKQGVIINDLYTPMLPHCIDGITEDMIHLNELGIRICAEQTERMIREAMKE